MKTMARTGETIKIKAKKFNGFVTGKGL